MKVDLPMPLCLALSLAISLLSPQALLAQQNEGSLTGTASNGSGAGIPNAKVSVRNLNTRDITETQTDSAGSLYADQTRAGRL